jgi:hypothetical protein
MSNERQFSKTIVLCSLLDLSMEELAMSKEFKRRTKLYKGVLERELKRQQLAVEIECGKQVADDGLAAQNQLTLQIDYLLDVVFGIRENKELVKIIEQYLIND